MASSSHQQSCSCHNCIEPSKTIFIDPKILLARLPLDNDSSVPYKKLTFAIPAIGPSHPLWPTGRSLQSLPNELYGEILSYLTIQEVTDLRRTSQYTRSAIDRILQYQELHTYAPSALRACLAAFTASRITLRQLYYALTHPECSLCSATLGTNLFLFTGNRVCVFCLRNDPTLQPIELRSILKIACSPNSEARRLLPIQETLKAIPGKYSMLRMHIGRRALILQSDIPKEKLALLSEKERKTLFGDPDSDQEVNRREVKHNPFVHHYIESDIRPAGHNPQPGGSVLQNFSIMELTAHLYMTSIYIPYLHPRTKVLDQGTQCRDCMLKMRFFEYQWKTAQRDRLMMGGSGDPSIRRIALINKVRKNSCTFYLREDLKAHQAEEHENQKLGREERIFRIALFKKIKKETEDGGEGDLGVVAT